MSVISEIDLRLEAEKQVKELLILMLSESESSFQKKIWNDVGFRNGYELFVQLTVNEKLNHIKSGR